METDYISRGAAIKAAMKDAGPVRPHDFNAGCARAANNIKAVPAADVRPVPPARWIDFEDGSMCSGCGASHDGVNRNYCPNCGAKMGGTP